MLLAGRIKEGDGYFVIFVLAVPKPEVFVNPAIVLAAAAVRRRRAGNPSSSVGSRASLKLTVLGQQPPCVR